MSVLPDAFRREFQVGTEFEKKGATSMFYYAQKQL